MEEDSIIGVGKIKAVKFGILSSETIKALSNVSVIKHILYTNQYPTESGLFDLHLGAINNTNPCLTCNHKKKGCLGHSGDLLLNYPFMYPIFATYLKKIIKIFCPHCSTLQYSSKIVNDIKKYTNDVDVIISKLIELKRKPDCI